MVLGILGPFLLDTITSVFDITDVADSDSILDCQKMSRKFPLLLLYTLTLV